MTRPRTLWEDLFANRLEWAVRARDEFISKINDDEIRFFFGKKGARATTISLYGETGVGKTTLILKLLGVVEEHFLDLADTVRGKITEMGPGTATATIYRVSQDKHFRFKEPGQPEETLERKEDLKARLTDLRRKVQAKKLDSEESVQIAISNTYFPPGIKPGVCNIIDLPGTGSAVEAEHEHVDRMLRAFVRFSNLVILVLHADKVAKLDSLALPHLGPWQDFHEKCRIVLTRSASARSVRDKLLELASGRIPLPLEEWIRIAAGEVHRHAGCEVPNEHIFPLEYGDSWAQFCTEYPGARDLVSPNIDSLIHELKNQVEAASDVGQALWQYTRMASSVERLISNKTARYKDDIEKRCEIIKTLTQSLNKQVSNADELKKQNDRAIKTFNDFIKLEQADLLVLELPSPTQVSRDSYHRNALDGHVDWWKEHYRKLALKKIDTFNSILPSDSQIDAKVVLADRKHNGLNKEWTDYKKGNVPDGGNYKTWSTYFFKWDREEVWSNHCKAADHCVERVLEKLQKHVSTIVNEKWMEVKKRLSEAAGRCKVTYESSKIIVEGETNNLANAVLCRNQAQTELDNYVKKTESDKQEVRNYKARLLDAHIQEVRQAVMVINASPATPASNVARALSIQSKINWIKGALKTT